MGVHLALVCSDELLHASLTEVLQIDGYQLLDVGRPLPDCQAEVYLVDSDAWPSGWNGSHLRAVARRTPCVVISGSPLAGAYAVSKLSRGFFLELPIQTSVLLALLRDAVGSPPVGSSTPTCGVIHG